MRKRFLLLISIFFGISVVLGYLFTWKRSVPADNSPAVIEGKVFLTYEISQFPAVKDDIYVQISKKGLDESDYFGASLCEKQKDDCIWLESESGKTRVYAYRLTISADPEVIRVGDKYRLFFTGRHYDENGNVGGSLSDKLDIQIARKAETLDFDLKVQ